MKIITLLLSMLIISILNLSAQNLIAVQNGDIHAFYTKLDSAIVHASDGDTIYLPGGVFGDITINKKLHIIGTGHNPDSTRATNQSVINSLNLVSSAANGSMSGVYVPTELYFRTSVNGYSIFRCNINFVRYVEVCTNISFVENIINTIWGQYSNSGILCFDSYFSNNIIYNFIYYTQNCTFKNNIILGTFDDSSLANCHFSTVENNFLRSINFLSISNCLINNSVLLSRFNGSSSCVENDTYLVNVPFDSLFVNYNDGMRNAYSIYDADFMLKPGSPFLNAGRDGTDIGIYGGAFPWKEGSIPVNPHFQSVRIAGQTDSDGNLNVQIKVAAQDN
jgi:hypothetical protein